MPKKQVVEGKVQAVVRSGVDVRECDAERGAGHMSLRMRRILATCFMLLAALACLSGCRVSDALTEVIYDQTSSNIDYNNETKFLINDSTAEIEDERVPSQESDKNGRVTEEKQNIVVYSSDPNAPRYVAKKSVWSKDPDFTGIEASETVRFYESDDPEATEQDIETPPEEEPEEKDEPETQQATSAGRNSDEGEGGTGSAENQGKSAGSEGKSATSQQSSTGGGNGDDFSEIPAPSKEGASPNETGPGNNPGPSNNGTPDTTPDTPAPVPDANGNFTELPNVDRIAAVGQLAVVVQMIGGTGALVAADHDLLNSEFKTVFADEDASKIIEAWTDDGSPESFDVDALEKSGAQLLIVPDDAYTQRLSSAQNKKLNALLAKGEKGEEGGLKIISADLSNSSNLKNFVRKVGKSLAKSEAIGQAGKTESNASAYVEFHDKLIKQCADNNGGLAYDAMSGEQTIYELGENYGKLSTGDQLAFDGDVKFTLLLDKWDSSVKYIGGDWNPSMTGIALSYVGYANSPVSYYIQAGGLVNNAAARGNASNPGLFPIWQFSSMLPLLKDESLVSYATGGYFDNSALSSRGTGGTSWDSVLLATSWNLSTAQGSSAGSSYGSSLFPKLIAATQEIKREMESNSDDGGLYHPYDTATDDVRGVRGPTYGDETYFSCIGAPGSSDAVARTIGSSITDADIVVNPHGLFSSWTEYGSVEGVLEAAWINDVVNDDATNLPDGGWQAKVSDFYSKFYRYDSVNLATIEAGVSE